MTYACTEIVSTVTEATRSVQKNLDNAIATLPPQLENTQLQGAAIFVESSENIGVTLAIANPGSVTEGTLAFQGKNVTGRKIDLEVAAVGETLNGTKPELGESTMNPNHLVAGRRLHEVAGNAALQLAFSAQHQPSTEQLATLWDYFQPLIDKIPGPLETIHNTLAKTSDISLADALAAQPPTPPNAFIVTWDISNSTEQAATNYGQLDQTLSLLNHSIQQITPSYGRRVIQDLGDGQNIIIPIPPAERLSSKAIHELGISALLPFLADLKSIFDEQQIRGRITADVGRVDTVARGFSSPNLYRLAGINKEQPRDTTTIKLGKRAAHYGIMLAA